jgi:ABC-type glutathione transport system ATPase component
MVEQKQPILRIEDLYINYKVYGGYSYVIDGLNLNVFPGEKIALVGESGCGKTTTVKLPVVVSSLMDMMC